MKSLPILIFFLLFFNSAQAQEAVQEEIPCNKQSSNTECDSGWLTIGIGNNRNFDFSGLIAANFGRDHFWQVKLYSASNLCLSKCPDAPFLTSISASRGYSIVDRVGRFAVSLGPSIVTGKKTIDDEKFLTPGLVADFQFIITPIKDFGVGIDIFSNINPRLTTYGFAFTLAIEGHK